MKSVVWLFLLTLMTANAADVLKPFPPPEKDMTRYVITLPAETKEADLKVELSIGKTVELEPSNRYFYGGRLEIKTLQGWGYNYYYLPKLGPMGGTLMAVDPKAPKVPRFVALGGEPQLLRYNSRMPIVVYVPDDVQVRYRIWRAPADWQQGVKDP